jgi:hypothetical protein
VFHDLAIRVSGAKDAGVLWQTSQSLSLLRGGGRETWSDGALGNATRLPRNYRRSYSRWSES